MEGEMPFHTLHVSADELFQMSVATPSHNGPDCDSMRGLAVVCHGWTTHRRIMAATILREIQFAPVHAAYSRT